MRKFKDIIYSLILCLALSVQIPDVYAHGFPFTAPPQTPSTQNICEINSQFYALFQEREEHGSRCTARQVQYIVDLHTIYDKVLIEPVHNPYGATIYDREKICAAKDRLENCGQPRTTGCPLLTYSLSDFPLDIEDEFCGEKE